MANTSKSPRKKTEKSLAKKIASYGLLGIVIGFGTMVFLLTVVYVFFSSGLPKISSLKEYRPPSITYVYADDGRIIGEFFKERRVVIPFTDMPKQLIQAFISAEDSRFYTHGGIDYIGILRAFSRNLKAGGIVQGGSTITQQVAKSFFLSSERTYSRKIKEIILAYRLNKSFSKDEILYLYLNQIYLGHGAYGVEAASENYFGKTTKELNLAECSFLAGLPQAPSKYSPFKNPEGAKQRQIYVLNRMVTEGYITEAQARETMNEVINIRPRRNWYNERVPCYTEYVRRYVEKKYGENVLYNQGLIIQTAVNIDMQKAAQEEITKGLVDMEKRHGFRGPMRHLDDNEMETFCRNQKNELEEAPLEKGMNLKGVIIKVDDGKREATVKMGNELGVFSTSGVNWSSAPQADGNPGIDQTLRRGDVVLVSVRGIRKPGKDPDDIDPDDPKPESKVRIWGLDLQLTPNSEAALISIEAGTGLVKAMIGGRDFSDSQFNRAIQSKRQPGSSIKPIIYAAALDKGYTPASMIVDEPIVFMDDTGKETWRPRNYDNTFNGPTLFRRALARSMNIVTIRILKDIGLDYFTNYARNLGIVSPLANDLTIALGSSEVSLVELVSAYSVFNNLGELIEPVFITRIADKYGNILEDNTPVRKQVIDRSTAYIMTSLLQSVIQGGTASRVRKINRPAAGKTGTTNDQNDAWFVGYTPQLTTGVWVGNDIKIPLGQGETGAKAASPIWLGFMQRALKDKPAMPFVVPEGVVYAQIDADTGCRPSSSTDHIITECFKQGTGPRDCHSSGDDDFEDDGIGAGSGNGKAGGEKTSKDETTVLFKDGL